MKLRLKQSIYEQNDTKFLQFKKKMAEDNKHLREPPLLPMEERLKINKRVYEFLPKKKALS